MSIYDTEEEQLEALKRWWRANNQAVIIGIVVGLGLVSGINFWKSRQQDKHTQASLVYEQLMQANANNQAADIDALSQRLLTQYPGTAYADYAALFQAKNKAQQSDLAGAKNILEKLIASAQADIKHVARLRLIHLLLVAGDYEAGLKLIAETDAADVAGFSGNYAELQGDLYVALNRLDEARTAYEKALRDGADSALLQFKLDDLTALPLQPQALIDNKPRSNEPSPTP